MGATFVDSLGGSMLFVFLSLYLTSKFAIGMAEVGLVFGFYTVAAVFGSTIGGGLADRIGRKPMVIFGLVASAATVFIMGIANSIAMFYIGALLAGLFADAGGPARQAIIADLLPEEKRAQGFGLYRVTFNLSHAIGPILGGLLAVRSYMPLFFIDIVLSLLAAVILFAYLPETLPGKGAEEEQETVGQTFGGYFRVFKDSFFVVFLLASALLVLVFTQVHGTLAVFLRDFHGVSAQQFGLLMGLNGAMVVLFQFPITRKVEGRPPFLILALGTLFTLVGFGMFGFVSGYVFFIMALVIITVGEMLFAPVSQAMAADIAPEDMRARYMAVYGFSWMIPGAVGIYLAGLVMDNYDPRLVWFIAAFIGFLAVLAFLGLHVRYSQKKEPDAQLGGATVEAG
jgi:MFS family permease